MKSIRILKRILIIPALVAILLVNISYASYRSPWVVKVEAATGNAYMDAFITALQYLGYSVTGSSAAQSAQKDLERYINRILADNKAIDKKRLDNVNKSKTPREQYLNYLGVTSDSGALNYDDWYTTIYCPANNIDPTASERTLSEQIVSAIQSGKLNSNYTAEEYLKANGSFKLLTMLSKDWMSDYGSRVFEDAKEIWSQPIGTRVSHIDLSDSALFKYLGSSEVDTMLNHFNFKYFNSSNLISLKNYILSNYSENFAKYFSEFGNKYILLFNDYYYNDKNECSVIYVCDVPENAAKLKLNKSNSNDYYRYNVYDSNGNNITPTDDVRIRLVYFDAEKKTFSSSVTLSCWSSYCSNLNWKYIHLVNDSSFGSVDNYYLAVPFGLSDVTIDNGDWDYTPSKYYDIDTGAYEGEVTSLDMERTNDDVSDLVSVNVNIDEVDTKSVDQVLTDVKSIDTSTDAATDITGELTNSIDKANTKAEDRVKAEEKPGEKTDEKTDTDVDNPASESDEVKKYKVTLVDIFPFCIPYDIYRFLNCLKADPVAPSFDIPIIAANSFGLEEYTYTLDLSQFDSVAKILRTMELLAFCVGLAFVTNNLIKH